MQIETHRTERGFIRSEFKDRNGEACSLQESSIATEPCIWLGTKDANPQIMASKAAAVGLTTDATSGWVPFPVPDGVLMTTRMHLTQDMARALISALECFVRTGHLPEPKAPNLIPEMTDPLGKYWDQPADIRDAPMDDTHVILTPRQMHGLEEYSASQPSGVYFGKCWKRAVYDGPPHRGGKIVGWQLAWYGVDPDPAFASNNYRRILVVE